jgi:hypothetical protein
VEVKLHTISPDVAAELVALRIHEVRVSNLGPRVFVVFLGPSRQIPGASLNKSFFLLSFSVSSQCAGSEAKPLT